MEILSVLLWTPGLGALVLAFIPAQKTQLIRLVANIFATFAFLMSCFVIAVYDQDNAGLQFKEFFVLNPKLGSAYSLGVDGLSAPLLVLATLLTSVALLASFSLSKGIKGYHICILMLEFGMLGVFLSQDWSIFYIFWELSLTPLFFLIDRWGGKRRHAASLNFVLYTIPICAGT
jgi:NADH-quinone oxidoreductase subunit M